MDSGNLVACPLVSFISPPLAITGVSFMDSTDILPLLNVIFESVVSVCVCTFLSWLLSITNMSCGALLSIVVLCGFWNWWFDETIAGAFKDDGSLLLARQIFKGLDFKQTRQIGIFKHFWKINCELHKRPGS